MARYSDHEQAKEFKKIPERYSGICDEETGVTLPLPVILTAHRLHSPLHSARQTVRTWVNRGPRPLGWWSRFKYGFDLDRFRSSWPLAGSIHPTPRPGRRPRAVV